MINALMASLPMLGDVFLLFLFFSLLFGVIGMQLYMGSLRQHCFSDIDTELDSPSEEFCTLDGVDYTVLDGYSCPTGKSSLKCRVLCKIHFYIMNDENIKRVDL